MALQALGQGYAGSGSTPPFSGIAQQLIDIGGRKNNFRQQMAHTAMDHELTSIRERESDGRTAEENARTRDWQSGEREANNSHAAALEGARLKAQQVLEGAQQTHATGMQAALLSHEGAQNALGRIYDTLSRHEGFAQDAAMSDKQHQQALEKGKQDYMQARGISKLNFGQMKEMVAMPRIGGSYESTPGGFKLTSDTEHRTPTEIGEEAKAPRRQASTPVAPAPTVAATPAATVEPPAGTSEPVATPPSTSSTTTVTKPAGGISPTIAQAVEKTTGKKMGT